MKFLAMHTTNQKLSFDIFTVGHLQNIFMDMIFTSPNDFWHKIKIYNFYHSVFLVIAINIPQRLKTSFVVQGHK